MNEYLSTKEASRRIGVSVPTIKRWVRDGVFPEPFRPTSRKSLYKISEIEKWEKARSNNKYYFSVRKETDIPLPEGPFEIIYADPPWDYKGQVQHAGTKNHDTGSARKHYQTVTTHQMMKWPIGSIAANNSLLFMWTSSPHLDQAIDLGKSWGFSWATVAFVWDKVRLNPGFYTMSQCELCLLFKKGKIPSPRGARNVRQLVSEERGDHSVKPEEVRKRIEEMFPEQNKIELFARRPANGWTVWGNEV